MFIHDMGVYYTWIFQISKISAFGWFFWVKRHKFYTLGRSRYKHNTHIFPQTTPRETHSNIGNNGGSSRPLRPQISHTSTLMATVFMAHRWVAKIFFLDFHGWDGAVKCLCSNGRWLVKHDLTSSICCFWKRPLF